jgi:hypothetical protein
VKVVSQVVLEWQEQARGETWAEAILTVLAVRFPSEFPTDLAVWIGRTHDRTTLKRWLQAAAVSPSLEEFRRVLTNGGT